MHILFPIRAVKRRNRNRLNRFGFQAIDIDADAGRVGSWHIERLDAAMPTKGVLCDSGIECVGLQVVFASNKAKVFFWHDQVQVT